MRRPFAPLDLAVVVPHFMFPFFYVRHGRRVWVNREILKSSAPSMVLFPYFPVEIRHKIYDHALLTDETVLSNVTDNGTGKWVSNGSFEPNYGVMHCCIDAHDYIIKKYNYTPLYKAGSTLFSPKVDQYVGLTIVAAAANPTLRIAPMLGDQISLAHIGSLVVEISGLENDKAARYVRSMVAGMTNLKSLKIRCICKITVPEQAELSFQVHAHLSKAVSEVSEVSDARPNGYTYVLLVKNEEGCDVFRNFEAQDKICNMVIKQEEQQGIMDIWMMLNRCVKDTQTFTAFPEAVSMVFNWKH